jgi:hypothetical protein
MRSRRPRRGTRRLFRNAQVSPLPSGYESLLLKDATARYPAVLVLYRIFKWRVRFHDWIIITSDWDQSKAIIPRIVCLQGPPPLPPHTHLSMISNSKASTAEHHRGVDILCKRPSSKELEDDIEGEDAVFGSFFVHNTVWYGSSNVGADIQLTAEFMATENLGKREVKLDRQFDVVTCMFAIHYFFASKVALDNFFRNVSINLKEGQSSHVQKCLTLTV